MLTLPLLAVIVCALLLVICGAGSFTWATGIAACLLAATAITVIRGKHVFPIPRKSRRALPGVDTTVILGLVLVTLTVLPMPLKMSATSGPTFYDQNRAAALAIERAQGLRFTESFTPRFCYTRNRVGTQRSALILVLAFLAAALCAHFPTQHKLFYLSFLALLGAALGIAGVLSLTRYPQGDTLWWCIPIKHGLPGPVACFVNRNYFAGCMAMLCAACGGLLWYSIAHKRWGSTALAALCLVPMAMAVLITLSRGAILACLAAVLCFACLLLVRQKWISVALLAALAVAASVTVLQLSRDQSRERLASLGAPLQTESAKSRIQMWQDALHVWSAHPLAGVGLDGFRMVYPQHRSTSRSAFSSHAENLYVQTLSDSGLIGVAVAILLLLALLRLLHSADNVATRPFFPATAAVLAAAGTHSFFDSPLLIPMNAMLLGSLLGLSLPIEEGLSKPAHIGSRPHSVIYAAVIAGMFGLVCIPMHRRDSIRFCRKATANELARALPYAPSSWMHWYYLGRRACLTRTTAGRKFGESCIARAAELDPNNYKIWRELGELRLRLGDHAGAANAFRQVLKLDRHWVVMPPVPGYDEEYQLKERGE